MKNKIIVTAFLVLLVGCGKLNKDSQTSDQKLMKMESDIQMLQQSVEMQSKSIILLKSETALLKAQLAQSEVSSKAIDALKTRMEMLEDDPNGFAK